jgi:hypothetical protein
VVVRQWLTDNSGTIGLSDETLVAIRSILQTGPADGLGRQQWSNPSCGGTRAGVHSSYHHHGGR